MCGIFGIINDKNSQAAQTVLNGLKKLEYRGYDSWGVAVIPQNKRLTVLFVSGEPGIQTRCDYNITKDNHL